MRVSVIVPVYNDARNLRLCLTALSARPPDCEVLVVDDGSTDDSSSVAETFGARVLRVEANGGPAAARNHGARHAEGEILFFVDADVVVAPGAVERAVATLAERPDLAAVFGSYDARPHAAGLVSRYRNLLHHYVHQTANPEASTFWAGCGAVRRSGFDAVGGFDERWRLGLEDVDLGYRLRASGRRILLDKELLGKHLKRWTLASMIRTDVLHRAVPWALLLLERRPAPNDLNLAAGQRLSLLLVGVAGGSALLAVRDIRWLALGALALAGVAVLNRRLYAFFRRAHGLGFAVACFPLHLLYFACGGAGVLYAGVLHLRSLATGHRER